MGRGGRGNNQHCCICWPWSSSTRASGLRSSVLHIYGPSAAQGLRLRLYPHVVLSAHQPGLTSVLRQNDCKPRLLQPCPSLPWEKKKGQWGCWKVQKDWNQIAKEYFFLSALLKYLVKLLKTKPSGQGFLSEIFLGIWQAGRLHLVVLLVAGALAPL